MLQDLRHTIRALIKRPSFAAGTMLVLGLAVGVNTAVFSLINALLLQPLHVRAPNEVVFLYYSNPRAGSMVYMWYDDLQQKLGDVLSSLSARRTDAGRLRIGNEAVPLQGEAVSPNYFGLAFAAIRYASHTIVPLPDADVVTFVAVPLVLVLVVLLACYLPARRAARVDPLVVLRAS